MNMKTAEQIRKFKEFFEEEYMDHILESIRLGKTVQNIDFGKLSQFDPELADILLEMPEEVMKAAELAIKEFDLPEDVKNFSIRLYNLSKSQNIRLRDIRSKHINKLVSITGTVRQKSDVRPQVTSTRFECPSGENNSPFLQL